LEIASTPGGGTRIEARAPLDLNKLNPLRAYPKTLFCGLIASYEQTT